MLLVFDWDGTLIDSTGKIVRCMHAAIADLQMPQRSDTEVRNIIGLGLSEAFVQLFNNIDEPTISQLKSVYSQYFREADQTPCALYPGVIESLDRLRADGHKLAVATGKSRAGLNRVLKNLQLDTFFDTTRCVDEARSKPHPLMLQQILQELDTDPSNAVMVGDTDYDLEMANNADVTGVAVSYGAHSPERLSACNPGHTIDHFPEILTVVSSRINSHA